MNTRAPVVWSWTRIGTPRPQRRWNEADAGVATSGTYRQFFRYRGHRYHHLLDPRTGAPRDTPVRSLTIMADRCMHADVAATALFGMPLDRAAQVLTRCAPGGSIVRSA